jgi:hypothetical protein
MAFIMLAYLIAKSLSMRQGTILHVFDKISYLHAAQYDVN